MSNLKNKPKFVQLPKNERYYATVLKVIEKNEDGSPKLLEVFKEDDVATLEGGEHFWIVYAPPELFKRRS